MRGMTSPSPLQRRRTLKFRQLLKKFNFHQNIGAASNGQEIDDRA
jgi:hypothetical protein